MIPPPPDVLAVDVDGTLLLDGEVNPRVVLMCETAKKAGLTIMLWSSAGKDHATRAAELAGITHLLDVICSKPGYILDDQGWGWVQYTHDLTPSI